MDREALERLDDAGLAAWDSHDADAFLDLFADDFVWYDWTMSEPIRDKATAREYFDGWVGAFPDMKTLSVSRIVGDDAWASEIEWQGTNTGPLTFGGSQIPPTNKAVTGRGDYFVRVHDGRIVEFRSHPDVAGMTMQLGLMSPPA